MPPIAAALIPSLNLAVHPGRRVLSARLCIRATGCRRWPAPPGVDRPPLSAECGL